MAVTLKNMAKQIQIRRDTAANWTAANPVLAQGEIGIELDGLGTSTVLQKIGDGVTAWDSLPYQESGGGGAVDSVNGKVGVVVLDKSDIGLGNVDNTSDADKPISNATQTALDDKASDADLTALGGRVTTNEGDIQTLQNNQVNPNNFVNKVTSTTQDMTGRLTVQTPLDTNTSDAASVGYVLGKVGAIQTPNAAYDTVGGIKISRETASSTTYISFDGTDTPNVT
jgi:hypothetical protein